MANIILMLNMSEPELTNVIGQLIQMLSGLFNNFGWTVVAFTVILKTILLPLELWQKKVMIKNNKAMKRMKEPLEKLQKQYANNREMYSAKQMELYKKEGYSIFGSCLPMLVTLVVFIVVFQGFLATVRYRNEVITYEIAEIYYQLEETELTTEEKQERLADAYGERLESWLWIDNIFMPDTWADVVPSFQVYSGNKLGNLRAQLPANFNEVGDYDTLIKPAMDRYNKKQFWDIASWNGLLILPILAIVLNLLTATLMKNTQPIQPTMGPNGQAANNAGTMKAMQYMMPLMIGVFSLFYSSAFTLYLFVSALYTGAFNLLYNIYQKRKDKMEELETTRTYRS